MRFISTRVHGVLDYLEGIVLLLAPNIFGFADQGGPAVWIPRIIGIMVLGLALLTRYEFGLLKAIPMRVHLWVDYLTWLFLAVSPWVFGFADGPASQWMPHLVVGIGSFLIALMTEPAPEMATTRYTTPM